MVIQNRTIYANDCLDVLNNSQALPDRSIDLIYLDPPFNSKSKYNLPFKGMYKRDAKPVMAFADTWNWDEFEVENYNKLKESPGVDRTLADIIELARRVHNEKPNNKLSIGAYLLNMAVRLKPMRRVLKDSGSIYLHCDPTASHYIKMLMDAIFDSRNFINEIVWQYGLGGSSPRAYSKKHDILFFYSVRGGGITSVNR